MNLKLDVLTDMSHLLALEPEWNEVLQDSAVNTVFLTWEWASAWLRWFGTDHDLWLVTARAGDDGRLLGIAPLVVRQRVQSGLLPYRELIFLGGNQAAPDHLDFIVRQEGATAIATALAQHIWDNRSGWDMLYLESALKEGIAVASLRQLAPAQWQQSEEMLCPFTPLPASWEDFEQQLGKNLRYNLKRYNRHLAQLGDVCYTQVAHADELPQAIASLQRLHKITRQGEAAEELFWNGRMVSFQEEVATRFLAKNWLRFYRLQLNGADIGLVYAFYYHNKLFYYMTGYDQELSRYGPGRQIMGHTIRTLIAEGGREIDFLRGDERYKFEWLAQPRYTLHLKIAASRRAELLMKAKQIKSGIRARL